MPHSPRWYAGRLWVCESGTGGRSAPSTRTPAGTRRWRRCRASRAGSTSPATSPSSGCRRSARRAVFSGIPITERPLEERTCGVCVVDLQTGQVVALVRFEDAVQEVFAVQVLPGRRYPDLINDDTVRLDNSFVVPDDALAEVAEPFRKFATPRAAG